MSQKPRLAPAILKLLASGYVGTSRQLAENVYGHEVAVRRSIKQLHTGGQIRITDWTKRYQSWLPVWGIADGQQDEAKPKPIPRVEVHRAFRLRNPGKAGRKLIVSEWLSQLKGLTSTERKKHS